MKIDEKIEMSTKRKTNLNYLDHKMRQELNEEKSQKKINYKPLDVD